MKNNKQYLEKTYVTVLSRITRGLHFLPLYRLALGLYPLRRTFFKGYFREITYLKAQYNLRIRLFTKSLIDHKVLFTGVYEGSTNKILEHYVAPGHIVLEAGANIGTESILLARLTEPDGVVYAFEPVPSLMKRLDENCRLNSLGNIVLEQFALGEVTDTLTFYVADESFTNQGMGSKQALNPYLNHEISVQQITLDEYCESKGVKHLDFIKMDIQGAELDLLKGGESIISRCKPTVFLEAGEGWSDLQILYDWLSHKGYTIYRIDEVGNLQSPIMNGALIAGNWLARFKV